MAYMDWNILSQREAPFKGQNRKALNNKGPLKPKDSYESKRTIPHVCGGGDINRPSEPFDPLTHDHNIDPVCGNAFLLTHDHNIGVF